MGVEAKVLETVSSAPNYVFQVPCQTIWDRQVWKSTLCLAENTGKIIYAGSNVECLLTSFFPAGTAFRGSPSRPDRSICSVRNLGPTAVRNERLYRHRFFRYRSDFSLLCIISRRTTLSTS